ncbi:MAG: hypothetical protein E7585_05595 [Ruminococcaceae bacterium]|nr:hypothetical protein [Oscillospiraceae bacterium]
MRKMRFWDQTLILLSALGLVVGGVGLSLFPCARLSVQENRLLAEFPTPTAAGLADGSYTAALDTYATERFPARQILRQTRSLYQILIGQREVGGVLLCVDGSLAKRTAVNERLFLQNLAVIERWHTQYGKKLTVAISPRRIDAREDVLPSLYDASENQAPWQTLQKNCPYAITFPDLNTDACWYRTDHHWSTQGAYLAYRHLARSLGYTPFPEQAFTPVTVSNHFYGTSHAAAGLPFIAPDSITLYRYENDSACVVKINEKPAPFVGFYDFDRLETRDGYGVFFGGNYDKLTIESDGNRPHLLVVKDSFANALLPFLARHYDLTVIDPRYCKEPITSYLDTAERVLLLCGMQSLCETSFLKQ